MYTLGDLETAKAGLKWLMERFDNYTGNNPDKYQSEIKRAREAVQVIEFDLKTRGALPLTDQERLERELDSDFPNARSKEIVEYSGRKYQRWFRPAEMSRSEKTVLRWHQGWHDVTDKT